MLEPADEGLLSGLGEPELVGNARRCFATVTDHGPQSARAALFQQVPGLGRPALIDEQLEPQAALDRPRFCIQDGQAGGQVALEDGIPVAVMSQLALMGHPVRPVSGYARAVFGRGQIILREAGSGVLWGGSDPRADGLAMSL